MRRTSVVAMQLNLAQPGNGNSKCVAYSAESRLASSIHGLRDLLKEVASVRVVDLSY